MTGSRKADPRAEAIRRASKLHPPFNYYSHPFLQEPLEFDPDSPEALLEQLTWRYRKMLRDAEGPVAIIRLLNASEIDDGKRFKTAIDSVQQALTERWEKKEREDRARGGRKSAKKMGSVRAVEESLLQFDRFPSTKEVWDLLGASTSQNPLRVTGADGRKYEVYRDGDRLVQVRDYDGVESTIVRSTYYKNYFLSARSLLAPVLAVSEARG